MRKRGPPKWLKAARASGGRTDWIGRALSRAGIMPPGDVADAIASGRVHLNDVVATDVLAPVGHDDHVSVDGHPVDLHAFTRVLMFHKPSGLIVAGHDPEGTGTVFDALYPRLPEDLRHYGWHAIGRLDRATTGLLLFTNDERLVQYVTSPESHLPKRYVAVVESRVRIEHTSGLVEGVSIEDGTAKALSASLRGPHEIEIVITEGRHHQVRRMLNAVHLAVLKLHREAIGGVVLDVAPGDWRPLTADEIATGLRYPPTAAPTPLGGTT